MIVDFLKNDAQRLITVVGRGGMGKTAMVCRLLKSIENGKLPDNGGDMFVDGIVYLSEYGTHKVNVPNIFSDMCRLLPENKAKELEELYKNPKASTEAKMMPLLEAFPGGRVILLLDNFENYVDPQTRKIKDAELDEALRVILNMPQHAVKVIVTTRIAPKDLALLHPERQKPLDLDKGLESPYAENILKEMDSDGKVGLMNAPDKLLSQARERTQGNPRALEALFAILSADRDTTLPEILADTKKILPDNVVEVLVGEAFNRLDNTAQGVMEALSVYARPVTSAAVDFMLSPFVSGIDSAPVLGRLLNMHFVRKEEGRYYLHPVDRDYAFSHVPSGKPEDRESDEIPFTQFALLHRGADYFEQVRKPREEWKTKDDIEPQIAEFDLRCKGHDYETAAGVLIDIDSDYLQLWGNYKMVIDMHERLLGKLRNTELKIKSLGNSGTAYHYLGNHRKARYCYNLSIEVAQKIGDKISESVQLGNIANSYRVEGYLEKSIEYGEKALEISQKMGNRVIEGIHLGNLAIAYRQLDKFEKACEYLKKALDIAREKKERKYESRWLTEIGLVYRDLGKWEEAKEYYQKAMIIVKEDNDKRREGFLLGECGTLFLKEGNNIKAIEYYEKALKTSQDIGDRSNQNKWLGSLGNAYKELDNQKAIEYYLKAKKIANETIEKRFERRWLNNLAEVYMAIAQVNKAIENYEQALSIAREIGDKYLEAYELISIGDALIYQNHPEKAMKDFDKAVSIAEETKNQQNQNQARYGQALARLLCMDLKGARSSIEAARSYEYPPNDHNVLALSGLIALRMGETKAAKDAFISAIAKADEMLANSKNNFSALYAKGLAQSGLALCDGDKSHVDEAISAYKAARKINGYVGVVGRARMLFEELAKADGGGLLKDVWAFRDQK